MNLALDLVNHVYIKLITHHCVKLASFIFFTFTICYETYEISKGNRQIFKLDHIAFVIGYIILIVSFWEDIILLLIVSTILFIFTLSFEIYTVRKNDLKNQQR